MSPLVFLAIPIVIFVVGSSVLYLANRFRGGESVLRKAPDDLKTVAPMLRDQREAGWPVSSGSRNYRS